MSWLDKIEYWDHNLLLFINEYNSPFFDKAMWGISSPLFAVPFYLIFAFLFYKFFGIKNALFFCALAALTVGLSDLTAKHCFKEVFERYRPSHHLVLMDKIHFVNNYHGGTYGFISSHASNMFAFAIICFLIIKSKIKWMLWPLILWASLIGYSRIYLGVHYPSDVIVGALVGSIIAVIMYYLAVKFKWIKC